MNENLKNNFSKSLFNKKTTENKGSQLIEKLQKEVISFCRDMNFLQDKATFYEANFSNQMEFNNCMNYVVSEIKSDIEHFDNFYVSCVSEEKHNCKLLYDSLIDVYSKYMIRQKGIYIEFIDYEKYTD